MSTVIEQVNVNLDTQESRRSALDATVGLRDSMRQDVIETSVAFAEAKSNRLMGAICHLLKFGGKYKVGDGYGDFSDYARYCAGSESTADFTHLKQCWTYWSNAPATCQLFADGFLDESALRYAGASKDVVILGKGSDSEITIELVDSDGEPISRAEFVESQIDRIADMGRDFAKADEPRKVTRSDIKALVEAYAESLVDTDTRRRSRNIRAKEAARKAVVSIANESKNITLPNTARGWHEYGMMLDRLAAKDDKAVLTNAQLERLESAAADGELWRTLIALGEFGGIPQDANEQNLEEVMRVVSRVANLIEPYFLGDLKAGIPLNGKVSAAA